MPNPVFLYESQQLSDGNETRARWICSALAWFEIGTTALPSQETSPILGISTNDNKHERAQVQNKHLSSEVSTLAKRANDSGVERIPEWIRGSFLTSPQEVSVSSPDYLWQLLKTE
jgi:hypothetical protein